MRMVELGQIGGGGGFVGEEGRGEAVMGAGRLASSNKQCATGGRSWFGETHDTDASDAILPLSSLSQHDIGFVLGQVEFWLLCC